MDPADIDIMMGTFTKSFGACGGYIAGNHVRRREEEEEGGEQREGGRNRSGYNEGWRRERDRDRYIGRDRETKTETERNRE